MTAPTSGQSWFDRISDRSAILVVACVLFALNVWPVFIVHYLPYQDLPNHLASAAIVQKIDQFPEFEFNGLFKTNAILFAWFFYVGKVVSLNTAAKLYTVLTMALTSFALPEAVVLFAGRTRLKSAALLMWPMIQSWFLITGMLNFALGLPLSILFLCAMHRYWDKPSWGQGILAAFFAVTGWYAHVLALGIAGLLMGMRLLQEMRAQSLRDAARRFYWIALPAIPAGILTALTAINAGKERQFTVRMGFGHSYRAPWELIYNFWDEYFHGFSNLSITSLLPAVLVGVYLWRRRHEPIPFFSGWGLVAIVGGYVFVPHTREQWAFLAARFIPFLLIAGFLRAPESMNRWLQRTLVVCALLYSAGMGVDHVRIERDRREITAAMDVVKPGAKLLPLIFDQRGPVSNTFPMMHAWGYYTLEKGASAPLLFASSRSYALQFKEDPPEVLRYGYSPIPMSALDIFCGGVQDLALPLADCTANYLREWKRFWEGAAANFDHVLVFTWDKRVLPALDGESRSRLRSNQPVRTEQEFLKYVPDTFEQIFLSRRLAVFRRRTDAGAR